MGKSLYYGIRLICVYKRIIFARYCEYYWQNAQNILTFWRIAYIMYSKHSIDRSDLMEVSYKKLWILLIEKEISPATLRKDLNIATGTMTKMRRNEEVALSVLLRICEYLDCNIGDICDAIRVDNV